MKTQGKFYVKDNFLVYEIKMISTRRYFPIVKLNQINRTINCR